MNITLDVDLDDAELAELQRSAGVTGFLTAEQVHVELLRIIRAALGPPVVELGDLHSVIYTRPKHEHEGRGYRHVFEKRPRLVWDGRQIVARGTFRVTEEDGIVPTRTRRKRRHHG